MPWNSAAVLFGIVAWLGPRSVSGVHSVLANVLVMIALIHVALNFRQLKALVRRRSIVIDRRFRGSVDSAQSGYAAGKTASHADGPVKVRFLRPAPVEPDLSVEIESDERITVLDGSGVVMEANPRAELSIEVPDWYRPPSSTRSSLEDR